MSKIVPADPIYTTDNWYSETSTSAAGAHAKSSGDGSLTYDDSQEFRPEPFESERLPATLTLEIQRFLRVANLIDHDEPRSAFLCRFHACEIAHKLDYNCSERGVRQFKTSLVKRLEQDEDVTIMRRREKSDIRELSRVRHAYNDYVIKNIGAVDQETSEKLTKARRVASVLFEVFKTFSDEAGLQVKAVVAALGNIRGLPLVEDSQKDVASMDLFDFLQIIFGFQGGNVANQREHLLLLLANTYVRKNQTQASISKFRDAAVEELMKKFFKNYTNWCKFLRKESNIRLPKVKAEAQQYKLLYIGLYLLIWGEAANLRFMPERFCYIFHHMAHELHGILAGNLTMGPVPTYGGGPESFLNNVVTPIYRVIQEEADKNKNRTASHSTWRNYDGLLTVLNRLANVFRKCAT